MSRPRRVAVLTTGRSDYGLLSWLLKELKARPDVRLQLLACGSHLSQAYGETKKEIAADGLRIDAEVDTLPSEDTPFGVARAVGKGTTGFARAYQRLKPDLLVVLGDRWELLAACSAAAVLRVPIAHIHGGEATEGVLDERVRHAVTKLSHLHFAAAEPYRRRLIAMGEQPSRVFNFGAPGLESLRRLGPVPRAELEKATNGLARFPFALVTYHPTSAGPAGDVKTVAAILKALKARSLRAVASFANADAGGRAVNAALSRAARRDPAWVCAAPSLGRRRYLALLRQARVAIGNSSSAIIEAPSAGAPTVNIGDRQQGRLRSPSVIDCGASAREIGRALDRALSPRFRALCRRRVNVYGGGRAASRMAGVLAEFPLGDLRIKVFHEKT